MAKVQDDVPAHFLALIVSSFKSNQCKSTTLGINFCRFERLFLQKKQVTIRLDQLILIYPVELIRFKTSLSALMRVILPSRRVYYLYRLWHPVSASAIGCTFLILSPRDFETCQISTFRRNFNSIFLSFNPEQNLIASSNFYVIYSAKKFSILGGHQLPQSI